MVTLEKCRELIPNSERFTDKDIEEIREALYGLAEISLRHYFKEKDLGKRDET